MESKENSKMMDCPVCGNAISKKAKVCPHCGQKLGKPIYKKWWFYVLCVFIGLPVLVAIMPTDESTKTETGIEQAEETQTEEEKMSEFVNSCEDFEYKDVARNPGDYMGTNFIVRLSVFDIADYNDTVYYKAYQVNSKNENISDMMFIMDYQNHLSDYYQKILEGDTIIAYCTFDGMGTSVDNISNEESEIVELNMYYAALASEEFSDDNIESSNNYESSQTHNDVKVDFQGAVYYANAVVIGLNVYNNTNHDLNLGYDFAKVKQGKKQYKTIANDTEYKDPPTELLAGTEQDFVLVFDRFSEKKKFKLFLNGFYFSDTYDDVEKYVFDVPKS